MGVSPWFLLKSRTPRQGTARPEGTGGSLGTGAHGGGTDGACTGVFLGSGPWCLIWPVLLRGHMTCTSQPSTWGHSVGARDPSTPSPIAQGDPEGINSCRTCRLPACVHPSPAAEAGPAVWAGHRAFVTWCLAGERGLTQRGRGCSSRDNKQKRRSLRAQVIWEGAGLPGRRDSALLCGLSRGLSEVRLPKAAEGQGVLCRAAAGGHGASEFVPASGSASSLRPPLRLWAGASGRPVPAPVCQPPDFVSLGGA